MKRTKPFLSVVIPCFNSRAALEKNALHLKAYLERQNFSYEVLIIDDGSTNPWEIPYIALKHGFKCIRTSQNQGKGAAVRKGALEAKGDIICFTDSDIPYELEALKSMVDILKNNQADFICGDRNLTCSTGYDSIGWSRYLMSKLYSFCVYVIFKESFDTQCGLKAFKQNTARDLFLNSNMKGFSFDVEIMLLARKKAYTIKRVPVQLRSTDGQSIKPFRDGTCMFFDLLKMYWNSI